MENKTEIYKELNCLKSINIGDPKHSDFDYLIKFTDFIMNDCKYVFTNKEDNLKLQNILKENGMESLLDYINFIAESLDNPELTDKIYWKLHE